MGLILAAGVVASLAGAEAAANAVSDATGPGVIITGQREGYGVEDTSSATRTDTPLVDVPQAVTAVTEREIEDRDLRSIADVIRTVPGAVAAQGEGHRDQIVLRGNNSTADFFIDGLRDDVQYYRPLYNLSRVEVLRGPNALIFGRGGGGGVVNRVTKRPLADTLLAGSAGVDGFGAFAVDADLNQPFGADVAGRLNATYERFRTHRDVHEGRAVAVNPQAAVAFGPATGALVSYEYVDDSRVVDRGIPSQGGRPLAGARDLFFGSPDGNRLGLEAHIARAEVTHEPSDRLRLTSRLLYGHYDKFYRNILPASAVVNGAVELSGYADATVRDNLFSQTDLVLQATTGAVGHTILGSVEFGHQETRSDRLNAFFGSARRATVAVTDPLVVPAFNYLGGAGERRSASEADVLAFTVQDQLEVGPVQVIAGLRHDRFTLDATDRLAGARFRRRDSGWSPRLGLVVHPVERVSLYASYARSFLPQSGDQFTSLDLTTEALKPERFTNYEVGAKWQAAGNLLLAAALYQLDRTNTRAAGPVPGQTVLTGAQRSRGLELEAAGTLTAHVQLSASYAYQEAEIVETTAAAPAGRRVPLVPRHQLSLWGKGQVTDRLGVGLGLIAQSKRFTGLSNSVTLPGYARLDAAVFYRVSDRVQLQANVENLTDTRYFPTAHNDNNISTGAPVNGRVTVRVRY